MTEAERGIATSLAILQQLLPLQSSQDTQQYIVQV
jgi:hypothetical protein